MQNGILTPSQPLIIIPSSAKWLADTPTPAKQLVTASRGVLDLNPIEPAGKKIIFKFFKKMGRRVLKKVLVKWSEGLKLNVMRIITIRKKKYLSTSLDNAFYKNIKKDLKRELNFKLSNLYRTIFSSKNGLSLDSKQKILPS